MNQGRCWEWSRPWALGGGTWEAGPGGGTLEGILEPRGVLGGWEGRSGREN